jgi:hypothetical protein
MMWNSQNRDIAMEGNLVVVSSCFSWWYAEDSREHNTRSTWFRSNMPTRDLSFE